MAQWQPGKIVEFKEESLSAIQEAEWFKGRGIRAPHRGRYTYACPRCGIHTFGGKEYCTNCGVPLKPACPQCGKEWRYTFQYMFCPDCGAALEPGGELENERAERLVLKKKETAEKGEGS